MTVNGLPPESQQWRRSIEAQLAQFQRVQSNFATMVEANNSRLNAILTARAVADSKNQIFVDAVEPMGGQARDLWFNVGNGNVLSYRLPNGSWQLAPFGAASLTADAIDGKTITGALLQSTATAARGIKIDPDGLVTYDASGVATLTVDAATGAISMLGNLTSGSTITGATITGGLLRTAASGWRIELDSQPRLAGYNNAGLDFELSNNGLKILNGSPIIIKDGYNPPSRGLALYAASDYSRVMHTYNDIDTTGLWMNSTYLNFAAGSIDVGSWSADYFNVHTGLRIEDATTTGTANAILPASGDYRRLMRTTSIRAAKRLIEDAPATDFLGMRPRSWFDKDEMEQAGLDPDTATEADCLAAGLRRIPGFVAEEVEEVDPLYVTYDGSVLSGVAYDRLAAAIHPVLTDLAARVEALENC